MVDTRPRAYEKARKRAEELRAQRDALQENSPVQTGKPPGAGFESERQRAKNALGYSAAHLAILNGAALGCSVEKRRVSL